MARDKNFNRDFGHRAGKGAGTVGSKSKATPAGSLRGVLGPPGGGSRPPVAGGQPGAVQGGSVAHSPATAQSGIIQKLQSFFGLTDALKVNK